MLESEYIGDYDFISPYLVSRWREKSVSEFRIPATMVWTCSPSTVSLAIKDEQSQNGLY